MKRRGSGEGSISKRADGRWMARISTGGKRKYFYGETREEVAKKLHQALHQQSKGLPIGNDRQMLGAYLEDWLLTVEHRVASSSYRRYCDHVRLHVIPELGKLSLTKLTAQHIQLLYAHLLAAGLSNRSVASIHTTLKQALKDAMRVDLVPRNVATLVRPPRPAHFEMQPLSVAQVHQLLDAARGDRYEALYILALSTGMREGELLALRWQDIDMVQHTVTVRQGLREVGGKYVVHETKTKHARRTIGLPDVAIQALHTHWEHQQREYPGSELVFTDTHGHLIMPSVFRKVYYKRLFKQIGLPDLRFHDLRHTFATLLLANGINVKVVSEALGHANITITLQTYVHVMPHMQQQAVEKMQSLLVSPKPGKIIDVSG
jgi:integrase